MAVQLFHRSRNRAQVGDLVFWAENGIVCCEHQKNYKYTTMSWEKFADRMNAIIEFLSPTAGFEDGRDDKSKARVQCRNNLTNFVEGAAHVILRAKEQRAEIERQLQHAGVYDRPPVIDIRSEFHTVFPNDASPRARQAIEAMHRRQVKIVGKRV